ncbi:MAG TPA: hypothetical protein VGE74_23770 [Gemmata sp.]
MRATVKAAAEQVAEIGERFKVGDAAPELVARLATSIATIELELAHTGAVPDDLRADLAALLALVRSCAATGGRWMEAVADGPELANHHMRVRVQKLYGIPIQDESPP